MTNAASADSTIFLALLVVAVVNMALALVAFRASAKEANRVFALTAASVALWTLTNALFRGATSPETALLWAQLSYGAALLTAASFLHFACVYPAYARRHVFSFVHRRLLYVVALSIAALTFYPGAVIQGIDLEKGRILTSSGVYLIALFLLASSAWAFGLFWRSQSKLEGKARAQARYVLYGSALTAVFGLSFNLLLPLAGNYHWVWLGPLSSLFFVGFCVYSIVTARLFDVRLLIRRTLVYSVLLAALAGAFAALEKGLEHLLSPFLGRDNSFSTDLVAALLVGFAVDPLKRRLHRFVTGRLFRGENEDDTD